MAFPYAVCVNAFRFCVTVTMDMEIRLHARDELAALVGTVR